MPTVFRRLRGLQIPKRIRYKFLCIGYLVGSEGVQVPNLVLINLAPMPKRIRPKLRSEAEDNDSPGIEVGFLFYSGLSGISFFRFKLQACCLLLVHGTSVHEGLFTKEVCERIRTCNPMKSFQKGTSNNST